MSETFTNFTKNNLHIQGAQQTLITINIKRSTHRYIIEKFKLQIKIHPMFMYC